MQDDAEGLTVWIPSGSATLLRRPVGRRSPRDLGLVERFLSPSEVAEGAWQGPGILRSAPTGRPWSL
ncbi:hypothetical protein [Kytococcus aerolatus]|uniref:hypothetical protein n=1 Tax=Kytococcus aerolatus TaxID=592308 RepID=UPI000B597B28|nr:hypothetical protein [Kytococcus aerolatus]